MNDPAGCSFAAIAHRYDALNHLMSWGRDLRWRALAAEALVLPEGGRVLDVGAGSGDMALAILRRRPDAQVVGVEPVLAMMRVGRRKPGADGVRWTQGDGLRLPFPDASFDAVASAFVLRNVGDVPGALAEQVRVTRPGGEVVCLEMTWPRAALFRPLFHFYFAGLMPVVNGLLSGQPAAYRFLPRSVQRFLSPEELMSVMERAGLRNVRYRLLASGAVAIHVGMRAS